MAELENIVPPLELCQQIPKGAFEDSALVWWGACVYPRIYPDGVRYGHPWHKRGITPAPTLSEIMHELCQLGEPVDVTMWRTEQCAVLVNRAEEECEEVSCFPAEAALKCWLELKGEGEK